MKISARISLVAFYSLLGLMLCPSLVDAQVKEVEVEALTYADSMPYYPGGEVALQQIIAENLIHPIEAVTLGLTGDVLFSYVVNTEGNLVEFEIIESIDYYCDMAAFRALYATNGDWVPGEHDGKKVNVYATSRISFADLPAAKEAVPFVDEPAQYKDGEKVMYEDIKGNLVYPPRALEAGLVGKVFVKFIVDTEGLVSDFEILQGVGEDCNLAVVRAVNETSGNWIPGKNKGVPVNSYVTLPVSFKIVRETEPIKSDLDNPPFKYEK